MASPQGVRVLQNSKNTNFLNYNYLIISSRISANLIKILVLQHPRSKQGCYDT